MTVTVEVIQEMVFVPEVRSAIYYTYTHVLYVHVQVYEWFSNVCTDIVLYMYIQYVYTFLIHTNLLALIYKDQQFVKMDKLHQSDSTSGKSINSTE